MTPTLQFLSIFFARLKPNEAGQSDSGTWILSPYPIASTLALHED